MHWLIGIITLSFAFTYFIRTAKRRRLERERADRELVLIRETGMPDPNTALGKKAREVALAMEAKLANPPPIHGTARWATEYDAQSLLDGNRLRRWGTRWLRLGTLRRLDGSDSGIALSARYPGHLLTVAGTGQGKSATQIVDNLLSYAGSVIVIDPKGELYDLTAKRRERFGAVYRLAPLAARSDETNRYNPLDELGDSRERGNRARRLAEMLIVRQASKGAAEAAFFENEAINLLTAIILYVHEFTEDAYREIRNLAEVRRICTLPVQGARTKERDVEYIEDVFDLMRRARTTYVRQQAGAFRGLDPKTLGSFLSEINSNLAFFDGHPGFAETTETSDFLFGDLARQPATVYLTIPLKDMHHSFRFIRAMVGLAFAALEEQREAKEASVLFILDEFPALKDMDFMRDAVAQMRSSGAWFWFFVQDVQQLLGVYGHAANLFLSQTDHQIYFGSTVDRMTQRHISESLGVSTVAYRDPSVSWSHSVGQNSGSSFHPAQMPGQSDGVNLGQNISINEPVALAARPLLTPFEVGTFLSERGPSGHAHTAIIFSKQAGGFPIMAHRQHWRTLPDVDAQFSKVPKQLTMRSMP